VSWSVGCGTCVTPAVRRRLRSDVLTLQRAGVLEELGLAPAAYGTHAMRRTKATLIYRRTQNLRAVQLLLGHSKLESTVRYLGIEVDDALEISEQTEI
jgi:integrase